jgi:hypothetical protein
VHEQIIGAGHSRKALQLTNFTAPDFFKVSVIYAFHSRPILDQNITRLSVASAKDAGAARGAVRL